MTFTDLAVGQQWHMSGSGFHYHLEVVGVHPDSTGGGTVDYCWRTATCDSQNPVPGVNGHDNVRTDRIGAPPIVWLTAGWTLVDYVIEELPV